VRVIGNNAVHPGAIDLRDDKATATTLLQLVNLVVDRRISTQKRIADRAISCTRSDRSQMARADGAGLGSRMRTTPGASNSVGLNEEGLIVRRPAFFSAEGDE
jgi:hypothetical protein